MAENAPFKRGIKVRVLVGPQIRGLRRRGADASGKPSPIQRRIAHSAEQTTDTRQVVGAKPTVSTRNYVSGKRVSLYLTMLSSILRLRTPPTNGWKQVF